MPPLRSVELGLVIKGQNRDALAAIAGTRAALSGLAISQHRSTIETRSQAREMGFLNRSLNEQQRHLGVLSLEYVASRRALLSLGVRGAVTGFDALTSAVAGTAQGFAEVAASAGEASAAIGAVGAQSGLAILQGYGVLRLGLKDMQKVLLKSGHQFDLAFSKLNKPQQDFIMQMKEVHNQVKEIQGLAEAGMFPGMERGLRRMEKQADNIKQVVYDTGKVWGYLADQASKAVDRNSIELVNIADRNVVTLRRIGDGAINLTAGFAHVLDAAGPMIDRMTNRALHATMSIERETEKLNQDGSLTAFFNDAEDEALNWLHTTKNVFELGFNYFKAGKDVIDQTSDAIEHQTKKWADWSASQRGQHEMVQAWKDLQPVAKSIAGAVGSTVAALGHMSIHGADNAQRVFDGWRTKVVPLIEELSNNFNDNLFPDFIDFAREAVGFVDSIMPGLKEMGKVVGTIVGGVADALNLIEPIVGRVEDFLPGITKIVPALALPSLLLVGWDRLATKASLILLSMRQMVGLAPKLSIAQAAAGGRGGSNNESPSIVGARPVEIMPDFWAQIPERFHGLREAGNRTGRPIVSSSYNSQQSAASKADLIALGRQGLLLPPQFREHFQAVGSRSPVFQTPAEHVGAVPLRNNSGVPLKRVGGKASPGAIIFPNGEVVAGGGVGRVFPKGHGSVADLGYTYRDRYPILNAQGQVVRYAHTQAGQSPSLNQGEVAGAPTRGFIAPFHSENGERSQQGTRNQRAGRGIVTPPTGDGVTGKSGRIAEYRAFQNNMGGRAIANRQGVLDDAGRLREKISGGLFSANEMAKKTTDGLKTGFMKAKPAMLAMFGLAAFSGTFSGLATAFHGGKPSQAARDFFSGATFGAIESSESQRERVTTGASALLASGLHGNAASEDAGVASAPAVKLFKNMKLKPDSELHAFSGTIGVKQVEQFRQTLVKLNHDGKLSGVMFEELSKEADKLKEHIEKATKLKAEFHIKVDSKDVTGNLDKVVFGFDVLKQKSMMDLRGIKDAVKTNIATIKSTMVAGSESAKAALTKNFHLGIGAVRRNMKAGVVSVDQGMSAINDLFKQSLQVYGLSGKQLKNYMRGRTLNKDGSVKNAGTVSTSGGKEEGTATAAIGNARGGLHTVGRGGASGADKVHLNATVGEGEDVAVINRHQRKALDARLGDVGGLSGFFRGRWPKHSEQGFAKGGIVSLGNKLVKEGYEVSEQSHFGGVHPVHAPNSYHYKDQALDVNDDDNPKGEATSLSRLAKELIREGWHVLWDVPGHFDHLHVDTANGAGGLAGLAGSVVSEIGKIKSNLPGAFGDIAQGAFDAVRAAANDRLSSIASDLGSTMSEGVEGSIKGLGSKGSGAALMKQISKANGWNFGDWWALDGSETGHGTNEVNPNSTARLRGQFLDMNYGKYGPGSDPRQRPSMSQQIKSMAMYIKERYGNPSAAWAFHKEHNYYGDGGMAVDSAVPSHGNGYPDLSAKNLGGVDTVAQKKAAKKKKAAANAGTKTSRAMNPFTKKYETHTASQWETIREKYAARGPAAKNPTVYGGKPATNKKVKDAEKRSKDLLRKKNKARKPRARIQVQFLQELLKGGKWLDDPSFIDPLTGEPRDVEQMGIFNQIRALKKRMPKLTSQLDQMVVEQNKTDEPTTVDLKGDDLLAWAQTQGGMSPSDAALFTSQNPDGFTVPNLGGPGWTHGRGIFEAIQELRAQLEVHSDIDWNWLNQKKAAEATNTQGPIDTRRDRLREMRDIFRSNKTVMKKYKHKLKKMGKPHGWKEQVADNDDIITSLREHLRLSHRLPEKYRDGVNKEIIDLTDLNTELRDKKPTNKSLGRKNIERAYGNRAYEQRILTGDDSLDAVWPGTGGIAQTALNSLASWKAMGDYRKTTIADAVAGDLDEQSSMTDIRNAISDLDVSAIVNTSVDHSADDAHSAEIAAMKLELSEAALRASKLENAQFGTLRDFAQNVGMRFLGSFAHGTTSIDKTGMALVHRNETIVPDPDGPFRNGRTMNALRGNGGGPVNITLVMKDNASGLVSLVDARIEGKAAQVTTRTVGQKSRLIRAAG